MTASLPRPEPDPSVLESLARELAAPHLAPVVDLVAYPVKDADRSSVVVRNAGGAVRLWLTDTGQEQHEVLTGRDPVGRTDPMAFLPYRLEQADPSPDN